MFKLLCVTNRALCREDFLTRLERIARAGADGIILREKDLSPADYRALARQVLALCARHGVPCILHTFSGEAAELGARALHLPLPLLAALDETARTGFPCLGASCHSAEEALQAERLGCSYVTAGHIFETDCKAGLPGRGLEFLADVCRRLSIPVYAIGGIAGSNLAAVRAAGAAGACVMSGPMTAPDPEAYFSALRRQL